MSLTYFLKSLSVTLFDFALQTRRARYAGIFPDERATLILAVLSDKDLRAICKMLAPIADSVLLPKIRTERAVDPIDLQKILVDLGHESQTTADFGEALIKAREKSGPILITGSLHFAGEALAHLQGTPAAFEECAQ